MTNNPTIDGVSRELLRQQFEEKNRASAWFVPGGTSESDTREGFVYGDFTTDMCWTCFFDGYSDQQSTIAQLQARIAELESGMGEPVAWLHTMHFDEGCGSQSRITVSPNNAFGKPGLNYDALFRVTSEPLYTAPPAPVAVVLPEQLIAAIDSEQKRLSAEDYLMDSDDCIAVIREVAGLDATDALNGVKS